MKFNSYKIAVCAVYFALIAVMTLVPGFGTIPLPFASITFVLIPIIVSAQMHDFSVGVICCTFYGLCSLVNSYVNPSLLSFAFHNPLISVLPRACIGFTVHLTYTALLGLFKGKHLPASAVSAAVGAVTNTSLVLGIMSLFNGRHLTADGQVVNNIIVVLLSTNFVPEIIACAVVVPLVTTALIKTKVFRPKQPDALHAQTDNNKNS